MQEESQLPFRVEYIYVSTNLHGDISQEFYVISR